MAFVRLLMVSLLTRSVVATFGGNQTCGAGEDCGSEETSLLAVFPVRKTGARAPIWLAMGMANCRNRRGEEFPCGETGKCCGDICVDQHDLCCKNSNGNDFACQGEGGSCCGNACAAPGSKCCTAGNGYKYPVSKDTACSGDYKTCQNRAGTTFYCGAKDSCSGDVCVAEGGVGCVNSIGNDFPCGAGSSCCGNACAAAGSKCCKPRSRPAREWYPATEATECSNPLAPDPVAAPSSPAAKAPFWLAMGMANCRNRRGEEFPCGETGKCCGDICADQNDLCCKNSNGNDFACQGGGGSCCGNACAAPGSKCCTDDNGNKYPVSKDTACSGDYKTCQNRAGTTFYCGAKDSCSGDICVAEGGVGCMSSNGNDFPCGAGSSCCGNACAATGSKCCKPQGRPVREWYPVTEATTCRK